MRQAELLERAIVVQSLSAKCTDIDRFGTEALAAVTDFLQADNAVLLSLEPSESNAPSLLARAAVDLDVSELQDYLDHFHQHDPVIQFIQRRAYAAGLSRSKNYDLFRLVDICNQTNFRRTKYYRKFLKGTGIDDVLAFQILPEWRGGFPLMIGFHRRKRNRTFNQHEMMRAHLIAPVLSSCLSRLISKERLRIVEAATRTYVEKAPSDHTVFVIDRQLNCRYQVGNTTILSEKVLNRIHAACRKLSADGGPSMRIFMDCDGGDGDPFAVFEIERIISGVSEHYLVSTMPMTLRHRVDHAVESWGLTTRETEVVQKIYRGMRNADIAASLGISLKTVENHISSIFLKAGVGSRTELVSRLATGRM